MAGYQPSLKTSAVDKNSTATDEQNVDADRQEQQPELMFLLTSKDQSYFCFKTLGDFRT
jgi:uncharacterized protein YfaS (alpha-2-macroglobulin family)